MRLPVLKRKFANKYMIRIAAGVLTVTLLGSGLTAAAVQADQRDGASAKVVRAASADTEKSEDDDVPELSNLLSVEKNEKEIGKEENVYLLAKPDGEVYDTIVTNHLHNNDGMQELSDRSELHDIENTKGDETFTADNGILTWQAGGSDIYYRGTTEKEAPVAQSLTYYLDGDEISPEQLAGKSGKVRIRFDYDNRSSYTKNVGGTDVTVKVPFAAVTTMVLDERFSHVQVTNGRLESNGDRTVAIGYALPGIRESLDVEDSDFVGEIDLPEYFEITADVENFELDTVMTIVANAGDMIAMKEGDSSSLDGMIDDLMDAAGKLREGSADLADGMDTLQSNLADYASGMNKLYQGSGDLAGGVNTIHESAASISRGLSALDQALHAPMSEEEREAAKEAAAAGVAEEFQNGKAQEVADEIYAALRYEQSEDGSVKDAQLFRALYDGAYSANAASAVYSEAVRQVLLAAAGQPADSGLSAEEAAAAIKQKFAEGAQAGDTALAAMYGVSEGMTSAQLAELLYAKSGASDTLFGKTQSALSSQLSAERGNEQVCAAVEQSLRELSSELAGACQLAASQAAQSAVITGAESAKKTVASEIEAVQDNGYSLITGAEALSKGTKTLADQVPALTEGITALNDATGQIVDGVGRLNDGSHELADGMVQFDEDGISKIVNSYTGDIKPLTDRLQAVLDAGRDYQTFSGTAPGVNGNVKFVYKLDAVRVPEDR